MVRAFSSLPVSYIYIHIYWYIFDGKHRQSAGTDGPSISSSFPNHKHRMHAKTAGPTSRVCSSSSPVSWARRGPISVCRP